MIKAEFTLEQLLESDAGREIAHNAMVEAFTKQASQYFYSEHALSNICYFLVQRYVNVEIEPLKSKIESLVKEAVDKDFLVTDIRYNKVLTHIVDNAIRANDDIIKSRVIDKLNDDETYSNIEYSIGSAVVEALRK